MNNSTLSIFFKLSIFTLRAYKLATFKLSTSKLNSKTSHHQVSDSKSSFVKQYFVNPAVKFMHIMLASCFFMVLLVINNQVVASSAELSELAQAYPQVQLNDIQAGQLLFIEQDSQQYFQAPELDNNVDINIEGIVANAKVQQTFKNTSKQWQHAVYVFPLPDNAAVNGLTIQLNNREIIGVIKEKQQAKKVFNQAKSEGKKAALLEQIRPNLFSINVANIPPNESISVQLTYFQQVSITQKNGENFFSLDYPMAITPRYTPISQVANQYIEESLPNIAYKGVRNTKNISHQQVESNIHIKDTPHTVNFSLTLNAGADIADVKALYHSIVIEKKDQQTFVVNMPLTPLEKDFELVWQYKKSPIPQAVNFTTQYDGDSYGVVLLFPDDSQALSTHKNSIKETNQQARQLTFIIDTSGSMAGDAIKQAKRAFKQGLATLSSTDYFQLITFNHQAHQFFSSPVLASKHNKRTAWQHVKSLSADGGTEIKQALDMGLSHSKQYLNGEKDLTLPESIAPFEQIIFLTDGAVGNEAEIFSMINKNIHHKRLFTVGLGTAPNRYFMKRAAQVGRGSYQFVGNTTELVPVMTQLFQQLSHPVLTDISVELMKSASPVTPPEFQTKIITTPNPIPDLYSGTPLVISYKIPQKANHATSHDNNNVSANKNAKMNAVIQATYQHKQWKYPFLLNQSPIPHATTSFSTDKDDINTEEKGENNIPALATLWAKRKINDHYNTLMLEHKTQEKDAIIALALQFNLVTPFTSLVAIDKSISNTTRELAQEKQLKNNLPAGQRLPQTALNVKKQLLNSFIFLLLAMSVFIIFHINHEKRASK